MRHGASSRHMGEPRPAAGVEPGLLAASLAMALLLMAFGALATLGGRAPAAAPVRHPHHDRHLAWPPPPTIFILLMPAGVCRLHRTHTRMGSGPGSHGKELIMAFDYMHPPEDFEYLGEWCKAWRDPATGNWTISQLLDGLDTAQIILSGEEVRELARLAAQHDPTDYELEDGELRRPMFASPDENGTAVNAAEGAGGEQARIHSAEALHRLGRF
mgnify:CR=1 FL=1